LGCTTGNYIGLHKREIFPTHDLHRVCTIGKVCDLHKVGATVGCVGPPVVCSEHIPGKTLISSNCVKVFNDDNVPSFLMAFCKYQKYIYS